MSSRGSSRKRSPKKKQQKKPKIDPVKFWGDPEALPSPEGFEISTPDPVAVVNSLGQPPLPGHGAASPHYFTLVYGRATQLAGALAMAGGIDDLTPEPLPEPEELGGDDEAGEGNETSLTESSSDEEAPAEASADEAE